MSAHITLIFSSLMLSYFIPYLTNSDRLVDYTHIFLYILYIFICVSFYLKVTCILCTCFTCEEFSYTNKEQENNADQSFTHHLHDIVPHERHSSVCYCCMMFSLMKILVTLISMH